MNGNSTTDMREIDSDTLQRIFEYSSDIISVHDMEGTFLEVSPACEQLLGYTRDELLGISPYDLFHPEDREKVFNSYRQIKDPPHIHKETYRIKRKDGSYIWFESTSSLMEEGGEEPMVLSFSRDVTKRKETEEQLESALEAREKMLSILTHDLRSSFQALQVFSLLLSEDLEELEEEEVRSYSNKIRISTIKVNDLLNNLIKWSKSHRDELSCNPRKIRANDLLEEVVDLYQNQIKDKSLSVEIDVDDSLETYADREMVKSIFRNLVSNAVKFSHTEGEIRIEGEEEGAMRHFRVVDNGVGMPEEKAAGLFESPQSSSSGTKGEKGTGIGLSLCRDFVKQHNGSIWVESKPGAGSTFHFTLPGTPEAVETD